MRVIPKLSDKDIAFGNIDHLPPRNEIPEKFKHTGNNKWNKFVRKWFFGGLKQEDIDKLKPKKGVDKIMALHAVHAILKSFSPKHEHKEEGCAYLMSEWFE